jgi:hypothetical protein
MKPPQNSPAMTTAAPGRAAVYRVFTNDRLGAASGATAVRNGSTCAPPSLVSDARPRKLNDSSAGVAL